MADTLSVMSVNEMVDAAFAGFDQGEFITIPALPDTVANPTRQVLHFSPKT
jgi:hypothetical protein